jgi:hypothetical protein
LRALDLSEKGGDVDSPVAGREAAEPAARLLELALAARAVAAAGLVPGDDDVDEALEEVLLGRVGGAPGVFERLVGFEVLAGAGEVEPSLEIRFRL